MILLSDETLAYRLFLSTVFPQALFHVKVHPHLIFMAYAWLATLTNIQHQKLIRERAQSTDCIFLTEHAEERLLQRAIGIEEVYDVLRCGCIERPFTIDVEHDSIECRMERYVAGHHLVVKVALVDEDPDLLVITAFEDKYKGAS